ncbi:type IV pilus biogenesis protein PilM [Domibacillus mangrovi]|nr:pilus assembly protein PilM [Domibacillus mangrovi]
MAFRLFSKKDKTINLVFTDYAIRYVEIKQTSPLIIERCGERFIPDGLIRRGEIVDFDALLTVLENCVDDWKIKHRMARFIVPDHFVAMREEKVDADLQDDEIKNYIFMQIGSTIHLPFEEPVFDVAVIGEQDGKKDVLLIAAPEEKVRDYMNVMEEAKLKPVAADIGPLSLYRLYHQEDITNAKAHELMIHLTENVMMLSIFHEQQPKFMKPVFIEKNEDIVEVLGREKDEAGELTDVLNELEKVINFYENSLHKGRVRIDKVFFNGDHPQSDFVHHHLETRLALRVYDNDAVEAVTKDGRALSPSFYEAAGLGLKEG